MNKGKAAVLLGAFLVGLAALGVVLAQTSTNFDLSWNVLGGGGGSSASTNYGLGGTVGQTAPGTSTSASFRLDAGFWPSVALPAPPPAATPTPTPTPSPTPTGTPAAMMQGDVDCDGDADSIDALKVLRHVAGLSVSQQAGCPLIGSEVASIFGDVDCDGDVDAVDSLKVLRHVAGLSVSQEPGCPLIGT